MGCAIPGYISLCESSTEERNSEKGKGPLPGGAAQRKLVLLLTSFFPAALSRQRFFHALFLAGLQIKGVALNLLNNIFLLHFALKATQGIFDGFTFLQPDFRQRNNTPKLVQWDCLVIARFNAQVKGYVGSTKS